MDKSVLIIGGGESSLGMARTIKSMGYKLAVVSTPGNDFIKYIADSYLETSENDISSVIDFSLKNKVVGVVPIPVDKVLWWQSMVANKLGLPFIHPDKVANFRNKFTMKTRLQEVGILCAKGILIKPEDDFEKQIHELNFPLIVKPTDGYASRGVTRVEDVENLKIFIKEAFNFSMDGNIVVEEFIEGREFNAEGVCSKGKVVFHAIIEKVSGNFPRTLEMGHLIPANISKDEEIEIINTVESAVLALGLSNGAFNTEIKLYKGKGYIIEVNGRLAGDFIVSHLLKPTTGRNMEEDVVNISVGKSIVSEPVKYLKNGFISFFNLPEEKKIVEIKSLDFLSNDENIIWWKIFFKAGELTPKIMHMGNRAGFVIVKGKTKQEVLERAKNVICQLEKAIILN